MQKFLDLLNIVFLFTAATSVDDQKSFQRRQQ